MIVKEIKQNIDDKNIYFKKFRSIYIEKFNTLGFAPFTIYYYGKLFDCDGIAAGAKGEYKPSNGDIILLIKDELNKNKCKLIMLKSELLNEELFEYISEKEDEKFSLIGKVENDIITLLNFNKED